MTRRPTPAPKATPKATATRGARPAARAAARTKRERPRWWKWTRRGLIALAVLAILGLLGVTGVFWYFGRDLPDVASLRAYAPPQTTRVLDRHGETIGEIFSERRTVIPLDQIPREMIVSVLAAEDSDFYQHEGLDYTGIVRAILRGVEEGRAVQGASTITQQVVKLLLLTPERTFSRKFRELILARRVERELSKDEILHVYLNHINFGHGRYGVQEAARFYFGKDASELTLAEASLLAGIPQAPARLSPRTHLEAARRRQAYVLRQLEQKREAYWPDIPLEAIEAAREAEPRIVPRAIDEAEGAEIMTLARRELREIVGADAFGRGGFVVHTTLDLGLQRAARGAVREGLEALDGRQRLRGPLSRPRRARALAPVDALRLGRTYDAEVTGADDERGVIHLDVGGHRAIAELRGLARFNPDNLSASAFAPIGARARVSILELPSGARADDDEEEGASDEGARDDERASEVATETPAIARLELGPQAAAIVIEPRTRDVLAIVGSYEGGAGFDRARQARRQPGSTFKPFVYALGVRERRMTPATVMIDAPVVYEEWRPQNYETWQNEGPVRLRVALAGSINLVAVRAIEDLGPANVAAFARELGVESELDASLALALGASEVRPIELVNAYATFAAGGRWEAPRFISRIVGSDGRDVPLPPRPAARDVLDPAEAYVVTSMLQSVTAAGGTAARATRLERPSAGKTGTSNEAKDAWFVGYTPNVVAGVWIGYDDRRSLGRRESGGRAALPVWMSLIRAAEGRRPALEFPRPPGVVSVSIDPASGLLPYPGQTDALEEVFLEGTAPTEVARPPDVADSSTFLMEQLGAFDDDEPEPEGDGERRGPEVFEDEPPP
ncbi:MAG: PBP1A family penicillin-binding protein [Myxococcales bacterium]|nr:PBP1A family penicillin-binding protein [Myxococcales bacterium]